VDKLTDFLPLFEILEKYRKQSDFLVQVEYYNETNKPFYEFLERLFKKIFDNNNFKLAFDKHNSADSSSDVNEEEKDSSSSSSSSSSPLPAKKTKADTTETVTKIGGKRKNKQTKKNTKKKTQKKKSYHK
jgi:hypothetical protein